MKTASEVATAVVGLSETQAVADIQAAGFTARIASRDGVAHKGIMNMSISRINLTIEDDVVTKADVG